MAQKLISKIDKAQVVEHETEALSDKVVEELIDLVQRTEQQEADQRQSEPAYWFYRVPFPGVRYYSYD